MLKMEAYFVSDAHLGRKPLVGEKVQNFSKFLLSLEGKATHLFLLGDIFDFWIEYDFCVPKNYIPIYNALSFLGKQGTQIHYVAGNHDFAVGKFFKDFPNLTVHHKPLTIQLENKTYHLLHGDGMLPSENLYRLYKKFIYSRWFIGLLKLAPSNWVFRGAFWLSSQSKFKKGSISTKQEKKYEQESFQLLKKNPQWAGVIHGHNHVLNCTIKNNQMYISTGNWFENNDYVILKKDQFTLCQFS